MKAILLLIGLVWRPIDGIFILEFTCKNGLDRIEAFDKAQDCALDSFVGQPRSSGDACIKIHKISNECPQFVQKCLNSVEYRWTKYTNFNESNDNLP